MAGRKSIPARVVANLADILASVVIRKGLSPSQRFEPVSPEHLAAAFPRRGTGAGLSSPPLPPPGGGGGSPSGLGINFQLLRAIALGVGPWDLKPGLLASRKAQANAAKSLERSMKTGKPPSGPYLDVPLKVHGHVDRSLPRGPISPYGPKSLYAGMFDPPGGGPPLPESAMGFHRGRIVFVRVSQKSRPDSWIHPGFAERAKETGRGVRARTSATAVSYDRSGSPVWSRVKKYAKAFYDEIKAEIQAEMRRERRKR